MPLDQFQQAQREHSLINTILGVRDSLQPIAAGQIRRAHRIKGESLCNPPGMRKLTLKDAAHIATRAMNLINEAIREFEESESP